MHIAPLTATDAPGAGACLASAFSEDPAFQWALRSKADNTVRLTPFFTKLVKLEAGHGNELATVAGSGDGVAVWKDIDRWKMPAADLLRSLPAIVRTFRTRAPIFGKVLAELESAHPTAPHYYLEFLGTRADRQGHGVGSALLAPMLERCDREGVPAYLESSNPKNIPFYARHGFEVSGGFDLPDDWPQFTPMWREPRS